MTDQQVAPLVSGGVAGQQQQQRLASSYGQIVLGPPGSGKTTYCRKALELLSENRRVVIVNLDPANESNWKTGAQNIIDIRELIRCEDCAKTYHLGPNASFLFCLEFLDSPQGRDWLMTQLLNKGKGAYFIFDLPGQVELVTHHMSISNIITWLTGSEKLRLVAVHLVDSAFATDAQKFISVAMLSLSTMLRLALPHINVLTKVDLLQEENLDFPLYFYTDTPEFVVLSKRVEAPNRMKRLLGAVCELLDEYSQVSFHLLSMHDDEDNAYAIELFKTCDKAVGFMHASQ